MNTKPSQSYYKVYLITAKLLVLGVIGYLLFDKLKSQDRLATQLYESTLHLIKNNYWPLILVIALMPLNWLLESLKWKILVNKVTPINLMDSLKGVLAGLTLSFATPHGIGDYFGRILTIQEKGREGLVSSLFISRSTQMIATAIFGLVGLDYLYGFWWPFAALVILIFAIVIVFSLLNWMSHFNVFARYLSLVKSYSFSTLLKIQFLSMIRYLVFAMQFVIIIKALIPAINFSLAFAGSTYIFLAKSILPTFNFLSDLGIREYSAIYFFEKYSVEIIPIVNASLLLWLINILIPTLVGIPSMLKLKWSLSSKQSV
ncbi:lysylphosphatidylglycerol synthase domain-containing protein [Fulvivirga lutea]|uniref:Flippase-like domain-containing protein n=1 Tax=Fulvivirga lutea TaxID=2810512 RepID=A0A974WGF2_9BACT|nr:lysylphosphatidylglycerol synthase domain-containing protein [Fulvivirga lutea]QSE97178.1 flippase-like domain-containing protein [Fulvivirga lutea]